MRPARIALPRRLLQASESLLRSHHPPLRALRRLPPLLPRFAVPHPRFPLVPRFQTLGYGFRGRQAVGDEPGAAYTGHDWWDEEPDDAQDYGF